MLSCQTQVMIQGSKHPFIAMFSVNFFFLVQENELKQQLKRYSSRAFIWVVPLRSFVWQIRLWKSSGFRFVVSRWTEQNINNSSLPCSSKQMLLINPEWPSISLSSWKQTNKQTTFFSYSIFLPELLNRYLWTIELHHGILFYFEHLYFTRVWSTRH